MNRYKRIKDQTTFVLAGHNIKYFAVLAIETLIKNCGVKRENILYFDDCSTDGTLNELSERNINVTSWEKLIFRNFKRSDLRNDLCVRVEQIVKSACFDLKTKYACFLDGDTAYSSDAIEILLGKAFEYREHEFFGIRRRAIDPDVSCNGLIYNIWQNYMFFDVEKARKAGILDNQLNDSLQLLRFYGTDSFNHMYDTGTVMYNNLVHSDIDYKLIDYAPGFGDCDPKWIKALLSASNHLGWLSSSMRNDVYFGGSWEEHEKKIRDALSQMRIKELCESVDLDPELLASDLLSNLRKSVLCE